MLLTLLALTSSAYADTVTPLAQKAHEILQTRCYSCHGENGSNSGGFGSILDTDHLIQAGVLSCGDPELSQLILKVKTKEMPPLAEKLTSDQVDTLSQWVAGLHSPACAPAQPSTNCTDSRQGATSPENQNLKQLQRQVSKVAGAELTLPPTLHVFEHHGDLARSGRYQDPSLTLEAVRTIHYDPKFNGTIDGPSYSQPLYVDNGAAPGKDLVLVTTEKNWIYAMDSKTGEIVWSKKVGEPVPLDKLECGNIDPLGITGTPAVSPDGKAVYFDAMVTPDGGKTKQHKFFGYSVADGKDLPGFPLDVGAALAAKGAKFNAEYQNQRAAISIVDGRAYVGYGGHYGDCGDFNGWVVGIPLNDPKNVQYWKTTANDGGVWAPGGVVSDGKSIYFATGNTDGATKWSGGEAIIRLSKDFQSKGSRDFFAPKDWKALDDDDVDIGGTAPIPLDLPGSTPSKLVIAMGKNGKVYLVDRDNLGGIGHEIVSQQVSSPIITAPAVFSTASGTYLVFKGHGQGCPAGQSGDLTAVQVVPGSPPSVKVAWCAKQNGNGSPIITTTDGHSNPVIWSAGAEGDNRIHAFEAETGREIVATLRPGSPNCPPLGSISRFQSPIVAKGQMYIIVGNKLARLTTDAPSIKK